jgi:putative transposase
MKRKRKDPLEKINQLNLTPDQREALLAMLSAEGGPNAMLKMLDVAMSEFVRAEFAKHIGAEMHERTDERRDQRNGSRTRALHTLLGSMSVEVPRARNSNFMPSSIERFKRSERALVGVIQEAFVAGVSTRKMEGVLEKMGVELGKSQVSELCNELDGIATEFRSRRLTGAYPYLWLDALYEKARIDGQIVSQAVIIAYGVNASGIREVIGIDVVDSESKESWTQMLRGLRKRGLTGVKLVISDAHEGLKAAIATTMAGAAWQRCKVHFYRNVLAHVPQARKLEFAAGMKAVFAQVSTAGAQRAIVDLRERFGDSLKKAIAIFDAGIDDALAFLAYPLEHHRKISSNNPIEHLNKEIRRRTRSIGIFPSVASALRLITMVLIEQSEEWMTERRYMSPESLELVLQS